MTRSFNVRAADFPWMLAIIVLFLFAHPYTGIRHDAVLYTEQALRYRHPAHFTHDLFFQFGSQDAWSLYSPIDSRLISALGVLHSNRLVLFVCQVAWLTGAYRLAARILPAPWQWIGLLLVVGMPSRYGTQFSYDEMLLTARLPAEALSLWAIALALSPGKWLACALAVLATSIHPLMGAAALGLVLALLLPIRHSWKILLIVVAGLAVFECLPFTGLHLIPFVASWQAITRASASYLFISLWKLKDWSQVCWLLAVCFLAWQTGGGPGRFWEKVTLIGIAGLSLALLADLLGTDALLIQIQSWRVLWLLSVLQWLAICQLIIQQRTLRPQLLIFLGLCWLLNEFGGGILALAMVAFVRAYEIRTGPTGQPRFLSYMHLRVWKTVRWPLFIAAIVAWLTVQAAYQYVLARLPIATPPQPLTLVEALAHTQLAVLLVAGLSGLCLWRHALQKPALTALLSLLLVYGVRNFYQPIPVNRYLENNIDNTQLRPFQDYVHPGDTVYWEGNEADLGFVWQLMQTASYFSHAQTAGMIFNAYTDFEAMRRFSRIAQQENVTVDPLHIDMQQLSAFIEYGRNTELPPLSLPGLLYVCQDPVLDFVVLKNNYPAWAVAEYHPSELPMRRWLYDCRAIRKKI